VSDRGEPEFFEERFHGAEPLRPDDIRTQFERDRGRVVHSSAFRRLQGKTQVMGVGEGDFHRTRLTHSIECAQIGAGLIDQVERKKAVQEAFRAWLPSRALIEAACFAHDLGHPPFGHGGEAALHKEMREFGGFEGNGQTLRLLVRLEKYKQRGWGINPTRRLVLAVLKYPVPYSFFASDKFTRKFGLDKFTRKPPKCYFDAEKDVVSWAVRGFDEADRAKLDELDNKGKPVHRTFDSSVMELADDIAYGIHDIEDIVARRLADQASVHDALANAFEVVDGALDVNSGTIGADGINAGLFGTSFERKQTVSRLVSAFVTSVRVEQHEDFTHPLLRYRMGLPSAHRTLLEQLRDMSLDLVIRKAHVRQLERRGERVIADLFRSLREDPEQLIPRGSWNDGDVAAPKERRICDYVAGMTDSYAERVYRRLFVPGFGSSSDEL
jgi:dGTPase